MDPLKNYLIYRRYFGVKEVFKDLLDLAFYTLMRPLAWINSWRWRHFQRSHPVRNILVVFWGAIGDMITSSTVIRALRENFPRVRITFLGSRSIHQIFPGQTGIHDFIDQGQVKKEGFRRFIHSLRKRQFDLAINLKWSSDRAALLCLLSRAFFKAGSGPRHWQLFYSLKARPAYTFVHQVERFLHITRALGIKKDSAPVVFISPKSRERIKEFWSRNRLFNRKVIMVHPGAKEEYKRWSKENYAELVHRILKEHAVSVVIGWGPNELDLASFIKKKAASSSVLVGPETRDINELAALLIRCRLFIGNCSAPMNVAVAVGTPSLVLMGPNNPLVWAPYGKKHRYVVPSFRCRDCRLPCKEDYRCQESIRVEDVARVADIMLKEDQK